MEEFSKMDLLLYKLHRLDEQGQLAAIIKADRSGVIAKVMNEYSIPQEKFEAIEKSLNRGINRNQKASREINKDLNCAILPQDIIDATRELVKAARPVRHLSYFERQTARALGKALDSHGNIDLSANANNATGQSVNRNFHPAMMDVAETFGISKTETSEVNKAELVELRKQCAQHCQPIGRTYCRYCLGEGWVAKSTREGNPSRNVNRSREIQAKGRIVSRV